MENTKIKSGYVAIVGRPNVGKSTMMNYLIGQKIAITSNKPQTTRNKIQTVYTDERGQIVFLDTPGINRAKNKLGDYMLNAAVTTLKDADLALWIVEPCDHIGNMEQYIVDKFNELKTRVILVINKTDSVSKEAVLESINVYKNAYDFLDIVPVSARKGENMSELLKVLFSHLPEGPMYFDEDTLTDQPMKQIVAEIIREKSLYNLENEVPHGIAVVVDSYKERSGQNPIIDIDATIICERDSHKGIVIGKGGQMLKKIGSQARFEIERLTDCHINLKLWVKVRKDWRESDSQLKNFGYDPKKL